MAGITTIQHGATIVATGGREYRGTEYGLGQDPRVMTQLDFEALLASQICNPTIRNLAIPHPSS